jgi:hypothetical protein
MTAVRDCVSDAFLPDAIQSAILFACWFVLSWTVRLREFLIN